MQKEYKYLKELKIELVKSKYKNVVRGQMRMPEDICNIFSDIKNRAVETMIGVYLNDDLEVNLFTTLAVGTKTEAIVATDEILEYAILTRSKTIILIHNHPKGDPTPSEADKEFILAIKKSAEAIHREFLDFIIIGDHEDDNEDLRYWSMFEEYQGGEYSLGKAT